MQIISCSGKAVMPASGGGSSVLSGAIGCRGSDSGVGRSDDSALSDAGGHRRRKAAAISAARQHANPDGGDGPLLGGIMCRGMTQHDMACRPRW